MSGAVTAWPWGLATINTHNKETYIGGVKQWADSDHLRDYAVFRGIEPDEILLVYWYENISGEAMVVIGDFDRKQNFFY